MTTKPALTLKQARLENRCRICGEPVILPNGPAGWENRWREVRYPQHVVLNHGKEYSHAACLSLLNQKP